MRINLKFLSANSFINTDIGSFCIVFVLTLVMKILIGCELAYVIRYLEASVHLMTGCNVISAYTCITFWTYLVRALPYRVGEGATIKYCLQGQNRLRSVHIGTCFV